MKKLLNFALVLVFSMALLTGCGEKDPRPQATPTPKPTPVAPAADDEVDEYTYQTVLILWKDVDGYWVNADGEYIELGIDVNGKAFAHHYDKDGKIKTVVHPTSVMASNKLTYVVESKLPAIENDSAYPGLAQVGAKKDYIVDINGIDDGYFRMTYANGDNVYYAFAGEDKAGFEDAIKAAQDLMKAELRE